MTVSFKNFAKISCAALAFGIIFFYGASALRAPAVEHARAADDASQPCDIISDPNCDITQRSIFPPGSEGDQLIKDTRNAEAAKQTQSTITAAANAEAPKYFCGISVTCYIVEFLDWLSSALLRTPLVMAAGFLDQAVVLALNLPLDQINFVVQGWKIIRDVSNMFYVLILLWVALGTIFDFPKYNIREILPKLVISALLINFSLPLGMLVINTTNALANVFYQGIVDAGTGINGEGKGRLLADKILENTDFVVIVVDSIKADVAAADENTKQKTDAALKKLQQTPVLDFSGNPRTDANGNAVTKDCSKFVGLDLTGLANRGAANATAGINIEGSVATVLASAMIGCRDAMIQYNKDVEAAQSYDLVTFARISAIIWKLILIPTLIFVLFAAALFIFIRTISLSFLLIFGPFVFLAFALPDTRQHWSEWWDKLFKWSFFMPVLMFMLFLSITMMKSFTPGFATTAATQEAVTATAGQTGIATPSLFTANMHFLFMLMLLIGSLTVAEKMGIEMAGRVRGLGQKALGFVKAQAKRPVMAGGRIAKLNLQAELGRRTKAITESEAFTRLVNLPGVAQLGGRYAARTLAQAGRAGETAAATRLKEKYGGDVTKMRPEQQAALFATGAPGEITGFYKKLDQEARQKLWTNATDAQRKAIEKSLVKGGLQDNAALAIEQKDAIKAAKRLNPELAELETTNPQIFRERTIQTLQGAGFNFRNASPEFIKSDMGLLLIKSISKAELQQVASTKEGFVALHDLFKKNPNADISEAARIWKNSAPGRAVVAGLYQPKEEGWEKLGKRFKNLELKIDKGDNQPPPPPPGRVAGT